MIWKLPEDWAVYHWSLDWRVPMGISLVYSVVVTYFSRRNLQLSQGQGRTTTTTTKGEQQPRSQSRKMATPVKPVAPWTFFRIAVVAHNIFLCLFSAYTFLSIMPMLIQNFLHRPAYDAFCDAGDRMFLKGIGFWTWIFYMSKYYELLDTAILLVKGRPSSFLQTYHHAGAIITMWMLATTRAFCAWVFVSFNSFIHTFMYLYYTLTCFGYQPRWKRLMTYMQLTQFFVGLPLAFAYTLIPGCIDWRAHPKDTLAHLIGSSGVASRIVALCVTSFYVFSLILLFLDFAKRTYSTPTASVSAITKKGRRVDTKKTK